MIAELTKLRELTQMIVDNPMKMESSIIIETTLNAIPHPIFIIDSLDNIKFANNYFTLCFNINRDKIINMKYTDVLFKNINFKLNKIANKKDIVSVKNPIFNKNNKIIGYVCIIDTKQEMIFSSEQL